MLKVDVNFTNIESGGIDKLIGRKAHIEFLQNTEFMQLMIYKYLNVFS